MANFEQKKNILIFRTSFFELKDLSHSSWLYIITALPFIFFKSLIIARRENINLFHCHGFLSAVLGYKLTYITGRPFIGTEQSIGWSKGISRWLRSIVYRRAAVCIAASRAVAEEFIKLGVGRNNIKIIPNGVDSKKFYVWGRTPHIKNEFVILSVGRLEKIKGHKYLVEAFAEIKKKIPGARLTLIGNGSERKNLEAQAVSLGVRGDIEFQGELSHDKLPEYYSRADIFVMPSIQEGFGIAIIEAMASGVPVIATKAGGHLDIIEDNKTGILVEPGSSRDISSSILDLCNNSEKRAYLVRGGLDQAKNYSWDNISARVFHIYGNFLAKTKIFLICSIFPPEVGGPAAYAENLIAGLSGAGWSVSAAKGGDARSFTKIIRKLRNSDICYVLTSSPRYIIPAFFAVKFLGKKLAIRIGGDFFWERAYEAGRTNLPLRLYYTEHKKSLKENIIFLVSKYILKNTDFIIFTSEFLKNLYVLYYGIPEARTSVIENAYPAHPPKLELAQVSPLMRGDPLVVLYAGRLLKLKNLDTLIFAFNDAVKKANQELVLKIIGEGPEEQGLKKLASDLKLESRVIFERPVSQDILFQELKKCWISVLPSISEVSPNFVLESIAQGAPIIVTRETGLPESIMQNLITFDPKSKEELSSAIEELQDPAKYQEYKQRIKNIDISRNFDQVIKEYEELF